MVDVFVTGIEGLVEEDGLDRVGDLAVLVVPDTHNQRLG